MKLTRAKVKPEASGKQQTGSPAGVRRSSLASDYGAAPLYSVLVVILRQIDQATTLRYWELQPYLLEKRTWLVFVIWYPEPRRTRLKL